MKKRIVIIEDDPAINHGIELTLGKEQYEFISHFRLSEVKNPESADLIILDLNLPDGNGLDFLKELRKTSQVPVLVLTAKDTELDEVTGLSLGADDYVTKPFSLMALRLRVQKLLGRSKAPASYNKNGLYLDFEDLLFSRDGRELDLSKTEIRLLRYFVENEGIALSREKILNSVWNYDYFGDARTIDTHVKKLRSKMGEYGEYIKTIWGMGYKFDITEDKSE